MSATAKMIRCHNYVVCRQVTASDTTLDSGLIVYCLECIKAGGQEMTRKYIIKKTALDWMNKKEKEITGSDIIDLLQFLDWHKYVEISEFKKPPPSPSPSPSSSLSPSPSPSPSQQKHPEDPCYGSCLAFRYLGGSRTIARKKTGSKCQLGCKLVKCGNPACQTMASTLYFNTFNYLTGTKCYCFACFATAKHDMASVEKAFYKSTGQDVTGISTSDVTQLFAFDTWEKIQFKGVPPLTHIISDGDKKL